MLLHIDPKYVGCREVEQFLYDYAERELDHRLLLALDNHLLGCQRCAGLVYSYQRSNETVRRHVPRAVPLPSELRQALVHELQDSERA